MSIMDTLIEQVKGKNLKIVLPEGDDVRVLGAAARLQKEGIITPILLGKAETINNLATENDFDITGITLIDPENFDRFDAYVDAFVERRKGKNTAEQAKEMLKNVNYFGTMMTYLGEVDGMVSGATHATGDTVRPALQIVKTKPGVSRTSGAMVMVGPNDEKYVFADVAINITLEAQALAEVAIESAKTAKTFGIDPKIAMLSFSTMGSAVSPESEKTAEATRLAKEMAPDLAIDGELQFDAAIEPSVGKKKAPDSAVAGEANVFIFPDLQAGNIGYKIAQRLGGYEALGPILQGMNKPINDLSRGCNEEDVYKLAIITAAQAL